MRAEEILNDNKELAHKRRTISDLVRYVKNTTGESPNYSLLLGAGCSVTSGIRPATKLIEEWAKELHERFSGKNESDVRAAFNYLESSQGSWYNPLNPYSSLFEKKYDFPSQRRRFVEQEVEKGIPSIGYAYLTGLVDEKYLNTIFTTNFDDLLNEAFYRYSNERPQLCAHDSSIKSISVTSRRPKIIKLHGDYLFDDIKSTLKETESLEQNTKEKLIEFCKEFDLIVVGYSGNDRSIMDVLEFLLKQDSYLKNGIYWCLRKDDEISHTLRNLLWKDKVYPVIIDGFDELMAEMYSNILVKNLDLNSNAKENKLKTGINYITNDVYRLGKNLIIKNEIENIKKNESSNDISQFIMELSKDDNSSTEVSTSDMRNLLEVDTLTHDGKIRSAYEKCETFLNDIEEGMEVKKPSYLRKLIKLSLQLDDYQQAKNWSEKLIVLDKNNLNYYLLKSGCIESPSERYDFLKGIIDKFNSKYEIHNSLYLVASELTKREPANSKVTKNQQILHLERSLKLEPSLDNPAWLRMFEVVNSQISSINKEEKNNELKEKLETLVKSAIACNPKDITSLWLDLKLSMIKDSSKDYIDKVKYLFDVHDEMSKKEKKPVISLINGALESYEKFDNIAEYREISERFYENILKDKEIRKDAKLLISKAMYFMNKQRDLDKAEDYLTEAIACNNIIDNLYDAIDAANSINKNLFKNINDAIEKEKNNINKKVYFQYKSLIAEYHGDLKSSRNLLDKAYGYGLSLSTYLNHISFLLLMEKKYSELIETVTPLMGSITGDEFEPTVLNYNFALKNTSSKFEDVKIRNMSAKAKSIDVKICAFILLDQENMAARLIEDEIDKRPTNKDKYLRWPIINNELIDKITSTKLEMIA